MNVLVTDKAELGSCLLLLLVPSCVCNSPKIVPKRLFIEPQILDNLSAESFMRIVMTGMQPQTKPVPSSRILGNHRCDIVNFKRHERICKDFDGVPGLRQHTCIDQ